MTAHGAALARNRAWYARNREQQCVRTSAWRAANPAAANAARNHHRALDVAWLRNLKVGKSCMDCGFKCDAENYAAFDWDHRPGTEKLFSVSQALRGAFKGNEEILAEVAKCDLRCRNCHAIVTTERLRGKS